MASKTGVYTTIVPANQTSAIFRNPFPGTVRITMPRRQAAAELEVFAVDSRQVHAFHDDETDTSLYLWGQLVHPSLKNEALLAWCIRMVRNSTPDALRKLLGHFVILIEDRQNRKTYFVSDLLGIRPWYVGIFNSRLVAGSDVLGICDAGLSGGKIDYDAVSCWLKYNHDYTGGSIVEDYKRIAPGAVSVYDSTGRLINQTPYAPLDFGDRIVSSERMIDDLYQHASSSFESLVDSLDEANLPLSGGYDSRLLCALAAQRGRPRIRLTTVQSFDQEVACARQVAQTLGLPLCVLPVRGHILDLFDDPLTFGAPGFPMGRNLVNAIARLYPGMMVINGYLGDRVMRANFSESVNSHYAKDNTSDQLSDDQLAIAAHQRYTFKTHRLDLLIDSIAPHADQRALRAVGKAVKNGRAVGRPLAHADIYYRHTYFSAQFLEHLDVANAVLPFYTWDLVSYYLSHGRCYRTDNYQLLFQKYFPKLAHIPHSSQLPPSPLFNGHAKRNIHAIRHLRRWSTELLRSLGPGTGYSGAINKKKLLARLACGLLAEPRYQVELLFIYKIHAFEQRLRQAGLRIDWSAI